MLQVVCTLHRTESVRLPISVVAITFRNRVLLKFFHLSFLFYCIVTQEVIEGDLGEVFVGLSFPLAPVTLLIIIRYLESPATTFRLVKSTRLTANSDYDVATINYTHLPSKVVLVINIH